MCGEALIKSMSVQPQVKCLHLTSISLAHLCYFAARLIVPRSEVFTVPNENNSNSGLLCSSVGKKPLQRSYYLFSTANEVSAVMFIEVDLGVIINVWRMSEVHLCVFV